VPELNLDDLQLIINPELVNPVVSDTGTVRFRYSCLEAGFL